MGGKLLLKFWHEMMALIYNLTSEITMLPARKALINAIYLLNYAFCFSEVNMTGIGPILNFLSSFSPLEGQPTIGVVRFSCSLVFCFILARHDAVTESGRLDFSCDPNISVVDKELCFLHYSAEMNPLMRLYHFLLVTAFALVVLWTAMIRYSSIHLRKIRRATKSSEREHLCQKFFKMFLFHVESEAIVLSVILGVFYCVQRIHFAETYICPLKTARMMTCRDMHHQVKSILNILFIGGLAVLLSLCIVTFCQAVCNKESFIKELLVLDSRENKTDDDGNHHNNILRNNANDGSSGSGFTKMCNHNEQHVTPVRHMTWNVGVAQALDDSYQDLTNDISFDWKKLGRQLGFSNAHLNNFDHENHYVHEKVAAMLNEWRKRDGEEATAEVLGETLKEIERKDLSVKIMTIFITGVVCLLRFFQAEAQPIIGNVRFSFFWIIFAVLASPYKTVNNDRLDFTCYPETNDVLTQECFSRYSAEMRSFIYPYFLVQITAGALFVLWSSLSLNSSKYLQKVRKKTIYSEKEHLCHEFWGKLLLHVCCEAVVIAVLLVLFFYTQKMYFSEDSYDCTLRNALVDVVTCRDLHHWQKAYLNNFIIMWMALSLLLCMWTICHATCKKEEFIKDLVDLTTGDDGSHPRDTLSNDYVRSSEFTKTNNQSHKEQQGREKWRTWTHEESAKVMECYYNYCIGKRMSDLPKDPPRRQERSIVKNDPHRKDELKQTTDGFGFQEGERQGKEKKERSTHEENVVVMERHCKNKLYEDSEYMPTMRDFWIERGMPDIPKDRLRCQARTILKNDLLRKDELKQIRERVGFQEGKGKEKKERSTHEENVVVMERHCKNKLYEDSEYMPTMRDLWIERGMPDIPKDRLRCQANTILKNDLLRKDELKQIRERVGFQEGKGKFIELTVLFFFPVFA
ncbi:PREDICTED: uncharacterized protein LOC107340256 [Acropora digitifera]|uniref:uncharacterized protein LOC107340256 n=1 Tax=Acropora digitifera TaxID=70779 RepID=UPI000779F78D|nr:PREDICTED: uncharacterized protein LOC107340256 [Acropora digitifera]